MKKTIKDLKFNDKEHKIRKWLVDMGVNALLFKRCNHSRPAVQLIGKDDGCLWMQATLGSLWWRKLASEVNDQKHEVGTKSRNNILGELKVCSNKRNLEKGQQIHASVIENGNDSCIYVATALVHMYARCQNMVAARQVFDSIKQADVVAWNALILGYAENGDGLAALDLLARMRSQGCTPNSITFLAAVKACSSLAMKQGGAGKAECRERGKQLHLEIGYHSDIYVYSTLIEMYAKCGSMVDARQVFDGLKDPDVVSWNTLILGYAENGEGVTALDMFAKIKSQRFAPNSVTFVAAIRACTSLATEQDGSRRAECSELGKEIHLQIGYHLNAYVQATLIDMYAKCGSMVDAREVFNGIKHPDVVSWTALILGYAENREGITALELFDRMKSEGCAPDCVTFVAALKACCLLGALESGIKIHAKIRDTKTEFNVNLVTCLVDFYAKCGSLVEARKVFDSNPKTRDLRTWNALLAGYCRSGDDKALFGVFEEMQDMGIQPDCVTFLSILTCCSHSGLLEKANDCFEVMSTNYGITPSVEHYSCMLDILGRSNRLDDAIFLLRSMPCKPNVVTWMTVLDACCKWENLEIGRLAFRSLVNLDDTNGTAYVLMAQIYRSKGMWEDQEVVLEKFKTCKKTRQM